MWLQVSCWKLDLLLLQKDQLYFVCVSVVIFCVSVSLIVVVCGAVVEEGALEFVVLFGAVIINCIVEVCGIHDVQRIV